MTTGRRAGFADADLSDVAFKQRKFTVLVAGPSESADAYDATLTLSVVLGFEPPAFDMTASQNARLILLSQLPANGLCSSPRLILCTSNQWQ